MIRFVHCVKRNPAMSQEEFRKYWGSSEFAELLAELGKLSGALRVRKNLTLLIDVNQELMQERGSDEPYDGLIELWWENSRTFAPDHPNAQKLDRLLQEMERFQQRFIDFSASKRFFTEWDSD